MIRLSSSTVDGSWVPRLALVIQTAVWALSPFHFLIAYLVLLLIRPHEFLPGFQGLPLMPVIMMGAVAAWVLAREKDFGAPSALLLLFMVGAMAFSRVAMGWLGGVPDVVTAFLPLILLFILVSTTVRTLGRQRLFLLLLFIASVYMALHGIQQHLQGVGWTGETTIHGRIRYLGFFNDPNDLGMFFVMTLPMAFFLWGDSSNRVAKILLALGLVIVFYGIYLTGSRGTLLATLSILAVYFVRRYGWFLAGVLGLLAVPLLFMVLPERFGAINPGESSAHGRVEAWYQGLQMFKMNPLAGIGWGRFTDFNNLTAHNSLVLVLGETGLIGLTFWLAFFASAIWLPLRAIRHWHEHGEVAVDPEGARWARLAAAVLVSWVGVGVSVFFLSRSYNIMLYLLAAIAVGTFLGYRRGRGVTAPGTYRILELSAIGAVALAAFFFVLVKVLLVVS